jgi:hypothetical protein
VLTCGDFLLRRFHTQMAKRNDRTFQIKHRKAEPASERTGFLASLGSTLSGSKFSENDEVCWLYKLVLCSRPSSD